MEGESVLKKLGREVIAAALAFGALTLFCCLYSNIPVHYPDVDGATDYRWTADTFYSQGTEGFSYGKTNNEGYHNMFDYEQGNRVDVLVMGSSHMEAGNVAMEESAASRLNSLLKDKTVYNIGTSGHTFLICADNLEKAVAKYQPTQYVVVEMNSVDFSDDELAQAVDGLTPEIASYTGGIIGLLQRNQFLRLMYHQAQSYMAKGTEAESPSDTVSADMDHEKLLGDLLQKMKSEAEKCGAWVIIVYHPGVTVNSDGTMSVTGDLAAVRQLERLCEGSGVYFLDMSGRFMQEYEGDYTLPYGFANTSVGSGHLNKYGHAMIADELYKLMSEVK